MHAKLRQKEWEKRLSITHQEIQDVLRNPEQVVPGDQDTFVAQSRRCKGLLRVPFAEVEGQRKVLTVYWTSQVQRYWREEKDKDEDSI